MAINNFRTVLIDDADGSLVVDGLTTDDAGKALNLGAGAVIHVAIIAIDDPDKRCSPIVQNPASSGWLATCADHPFQNHDHVYAVGSADSNSQDLVLWVNEMCVGKPALKK